MYQPIHQHSVYQLYIIRFGTIITSHHTLKAYFVSINTHNYESQLAVSLRPHTTQKMSLIVSFFFSILPAELIGSDAISGGMNARDSRECV